MAVSRRRCRLPLSHPSSSRLVWCRHRRACRLALGSFHSRLCVVKSDPCHRFQLLAAKTFLSSVLEGDNRRVFSEFPFVSGVFGPSVAWLVIAAFPSTVSKIGSWWCRLTLFLQVLECYRRRLVAAGSSPVSLFSVWLRGLLGLLVQMEWRYRST